MIEWHKGVTTKVYKIETKIIEHFPRDKALNVDIFRPWFKQEKSKRMTQGKEENSKGRNTAWFSGVNLSGRQPWELINQWHWCGVPQGFANIQHPTSYVEMIGLNHSVSCLDVTEGFWNWEVILQRKIFQECWNDLKRRLVGQRHHVDKSEDHLRVGPTGWS